MADSNGWVKLYRVLLDKPIWQLSSPEQKVILITLLLMANHKTQKWEWNGKQFECTPGQFISSLEKITERCGKDISIRNVRTAIKRFENLDFLTNESTKTGRLITIANWELYQGDKESPDKEADKDLTKSRQRPDKDLTTNKNNKEYKNDKEGKKKEYICPEPGIPAPDCSEIFLPLVDGTFYNVPLQKIRNWEAAFPAVDAMHELKKMLTWLDSNQTKRKTARGIERFINNWLSRTQDNGGSKQEIHKLVPQTTKDGRVLE